MSGTSGAERIYAGINIKGLMIKSIRKRLRCFYIRKASRITAVTSEVKDNIVSKAFWEKTAVTNQWRGHGNLFLNHQINISRKNWGLKKTISTVIYVGTLGLLQDLRLMAACAEQFEILQ